MSYAPDDNAEVEHDVYLKGLPHSKGRPNWLIFCHAIGCDASAEWAIVAENREIRLCPDHLDTITKALVSLRGVH